MRQAFVFGAEKSAHRLIGTMVFGCLGAAAAAVSCSSHSGADSLCHPSCGSLDDGGDDVSDATIDNNKGGTPEASDDGSGDATGDVTSDSPTEAMADVASEPSEAATDGGGDATADGSSDAPVDVAIDHCTAFCGAGSVCTDITVDPNNCGACGNACGLSGSCSNSQCVCGGFSSCTISGTSNSKCVDETSDPNHCGGCNTVCTNGYCLSATCQIPSSFGSSSGTIKSIALDSAGDIFWTVGGSSGALYVKPVGIAANTVESSLPNPIALAVGYGSVFWADLNTGEIDSMTTVRAVNNNPLIVPVVPAPDSGSPQPIALAVDAINVYWADIGAGAIYQVPRGGGTTITLATGQNQPIAIKTDGANVYWINQGVSSADGAVLTTPVWSSDGGSPGADAGDEGGTDAEAGTSGPGGGTVLASGQTSPQGIAIDGTYVYWTSGQNAGLVQAVAKAGGGTAITIATGQKTPYGVAVDPSTVSGARYVYWTNAATTGTNSNTVFRAPVPGTAGIPTQIASGQSTPQAIDVDDNNVYWANAGNGNIMKLTTH